MTDITVKISTPQLDAVIERLGPSERSELHREIAAEVSETVRDHLRDYALSHHDTANRLGARPTGNLEDASVRHTPRPGADRNPAKEQAGSHHSGSGDRVRAQCGGFEGKGH